MNLPNAAIEAERIVVEKLAAYETSRDLDVIDRLIIKLLSKWPTLNLTELGKACGMTPSTISRRMKKPAFREAYDRITGSTMDLLEQNVRRAHHRLGSLISHKDERVALEACKLTLATYHNQRSMALEKKPSIVYKTTIEADGSLVQGVLEAEVVGKT